uniref:Uncharacterized protein n=1 Tax=Arundo donax TaxID=35708 RepID=A0A0A8ZM19_ARUDO
MCSINSTISKRVSTFCTDDAVENKYLT